MKLILPGFIILLIGGFFVWKTVIHKTDITGAPPYLVDDNPPDDWQLDRYAYLRYCSTLANVPVKFLNSRRYSCIRSRCIFLPVEPCTHSEGGRTFGTRGSLRGRVSGV